MHIIVSNFMCMFLTCLRSTWGYSSRRGRCNSNFCPIFVILSWESVASYAQIWTKFHMYVFVYRRHVPVKNGDISRKVQYDRDVLCDSLNGIAIDQSILLFIRIWRPCGGGGGAESRECVRIWYTIRGKNNTELSKCSVLI